MSDAMAKKPHKNWAEADPEDPKVGVSRDGTGVNLNWKALVGIITAAVLATVAYMNIVTTSNGHTETLKAHSESLLELKGYVHNVDVKVDALLIEAGRNPHQVVRDAAAADRAAK